MSSIDEKAGAFVGKSMSAGQTYDMGCGWIVECGEHGIDAGFFVSGSSISLLYAAPETIMNMNSTIASVSRGDGRQMFHADYATSVRNVNYEAYIDEITIQGDDDVAIALTSRALYAGTRASFQGATVYV